MLWASNTLSRILRGARRGEAQPWRLEQAGVEPAAGVRSVALTDVSAPAPSAETPPPEPPPDLEAIRRRSFAEGLAQGRDQGRREAASELESKLTAVESVVGSLFGYKRRLREEAEREVVDLAFAVARRVIRREISIDPTTAVGIVRACLDQCAESEVERILVSPQDFAVVREQVGDAGEVVASDDVPAGGAVFETKQGRLDARIETQLEEIATGLADS